jgi:uncharacterized protein YjbI with pentapeptide repeats
VTLTSSQEGFAMTADDPIYLRETKRQVIAEKANLSGSSFNDVNLSGARFVNVKLAGAELEDVNLSDVAIHNANCAGLTLRDADLRGASIAHSLTAGMTIDGIAVSDLMAAYRAALEKSQS